MGRIPISENQLGHWSYHQHTVDGQFHSECLFVPDYYCNEVWNPSPDNRRTTFAEFKKEFPYASPQSISVRSKNQNKFFR
jgi:hypothetical protein